MAAERRIDAELRMPNGHRVGTLRDVRDVYLEAGAPGPDGHIYYQWVQGLSGAPVRWPAALADILVR